MDCGNWISASASTCSPKTFWVSASNVTTICPSASRFTRDSGTFSGEVGVAVSPLFCEHPQTSKMDKRSKEKAVFMQKLMFIRAGGFKDHGRQIEPQLQSVLHGPNGLLKPHLTIELY